MGKAHCSFCAVVARAPRIKLQIPRDGCDPRDPSAYCAFGLGKAESASRAFMDQQASGARTHQTENFRVPQFATVERAPMFVNGMPVID
jgi:hypothetical protein